MHKGPKRWFSGKGPFSEINAFSTRIQMAKAIKCHGAGGDAVHQALADSENPEFVEGVVNAHKIATDPNYGKKE
ncbi:MAG TPA: hypothetical protein P5262_03530 [Candidatus Moranbacteria bacterium]|nr:hypothetical protein [Candidatus Moranbacteria bacterium]